MVDPYNDNDKNNFIRWLQINHDYVIDYLRLIKANIDMLSLSPRAYMMLKMESLYLIADIFPLSAVQLAAYDLSDEKIAKEISSHCFYYLKDIRNELVDYVSKMKQELGNATIESDTEINPEVLLSEEAFKIEFLNYLVDHDIPIERFDLTTRTYNLLKRSKVNYLSEAVKLYPNGFAELRNFGKISIDEIKTKIEEQAMLFAVNNKKIIIPDSEADYISETKQEQGNITTGSEIEINPEVLLSEAVELYPNGVAELRNIGQKLIDEITIEEQATQIAINNKKSIIPNSEVDYVHKMKQEQINEATESEIAINPEVLLSEEAFKIKFLNYLDDYDIPIERFDLTIRLYNALKRSKVNYLSEAVKLYPNGFVELRNVGQKSIDEIKKLIEEQAAQFAVNKKKTVLTDSEEVEPAVEKYIPQSIYDLIIMPKYRDRVIKYYEFIGLMISDLDFSTRTKTCLGMANISSFSDLLRFYPAYLSRISHLTEKSINEIEETVHEVLEKHSQSVMEFVLDENNFSFDDDLVCKRILDLYEKYKPFYGISFDEFRQNLPKIISDTSLKKCIGLLISKNIIEYVDYRCYKVYPSVYDVAKELADDTENDNFMLLLKLWSGMTLEQIANEIGVTRERVRQKTEKAIYTLKFGNRVFTEDYYAYLYENYAIEEKTWVNDIGVSEIAYRYLKKCYSSDNSKKRNMETALDDDNVSVSLKYKIIDAINKKKVEIDGRMFVRNRGVIEDYIIYKYCQDEIVFDDFCDLYNRILQANGIPENPEIYYTEEVKRTRNNRLSESHKVLWKTGMRFRYYDVDGKDYQELLDTIGIYSYHNTGLSTLYWINNYPDIMGKYDIRDQYELHNLLKKIIPEGSINGIHFDRMPGITFGNFDRDQMVYELMCRYSPISSDDLADVFYNEYGYDKGSCQANYFNCIRQFYHNGVYSVDFKSIPADRVSIFINALNKDFYFDNEVRDIYASIYPDADLDEINPRSMQEIGFTAYARYYLKSKWPSLSEFFRHLLTKDELFNYSVYSKRYGYIMLYDKTLLSLRASFDLFTLGDGTALSIDRLAKANISKQDIRDYCEAVDLFVGDSSFFTLRSLAKAGFEASLENLGFDNSFYERILEICGRFNSSYCENVMVFAKGEGTTNFTKKDFILSVVSKFRSIQIDDLVDYIADEYGIRFKEKYRLTGLFSDTDIYYDQIMDTVYANKEAYYDELG